jgi:calcineurin-like phosphoesterase family protein
MDTTLVGLWNSVVTKESDDIWLLGDFAFSKARYDMFKLFYSLRGRKHLIVGNHDEKNPTVMRLPWETVDHLRTLKVDGKRAELCHYPLETWKASWRGTMMLHGHCHGTLKRKLPKRFDVGVDTPLGQNGPIPFELLWEMALTETFTPVDGHGDKNEPLT